MKLTINNQPTETQAQNLQELASELHLPAKGVAVAVANKMVPRANWEQTPLVEGAVIVIIKAACGG